ncbi:hypothetical protein C8F01DRAFT_549426 [Mycena amicta]|nr:hypothetical protein C8F01DRAFT_549426 [Mycena amicta]
MITDSPSISPPVAISLAFVAILYGMHLLVFPAAVYVLSRKQLKTHIIVMIAAIVFMFCMSTILTVTLFTATILDGTIVGIYFGQSVRSKILMWPRNINLIVGDAIVVWRMLVLYQNKVIRGGILFLLFAFSALSLFNSMGLPLNGPFSRAIFLSSLATFLSFGTNLVATGAITWKAWTYHRKNPQSWRGTQPSNAVNNAFLLLIETGALYLSWQLLVAIISYNSSYCNNDALSCKSVQFASNAMTESTTIVAALYPTSTLVIVGLKKSIADKYTPSPSTNASSYVISSPTSSDGRGGIGLVRPAGGDAEWKAKERYGNAF